MTMMNDSVSRFAGLEIDDVSAPGGKPAGWAPNQPWQVGDVGAPAPDTTPAPAPRAGTEGTGEAGPIDTEGRARAIASDGIAAKHGIIAREATLFTWGTNGQWGDAAYKARQELRARPLLGTFVPEVKARVAAEGRRSDTVALSSLTYGVDGRLRTKATSGGAVMTSHSF